MKSVGIWTEIVMIIFKFWREDILIGGIVKMSSKSNFSSSSIWMYSGRNVQVIPLYQKYLRGLSIIKSPSLQNASKFAIFLEYKTDEGFFFVFHFMLCYYPIFPLMNEDIYIDIPGPDRK